MSKNQHLEGFFSKSIKTHHKELYCRKIQVMPLSHCVTDGDFRLYSRERRYLVECKETNSLKKYSYEFNRLTQEANLLLFDRHSHLSTSYVCIMFWMGRHDKSLLYLIPIGHYVAFRERWHKKSVNFDDARIEWAEYRIHPIKGSMFDFAGKFS